VATVYHITAVSGVKGDQLFKTYSGEDGCIDKEEYARLVKSPGLNGILGTILRTYAEDLSKVGGSLSQAKLRDQVADAVVSYLQLVSAKNHTRVGWICERLTNGSVPMSFTATVLRELALQKQNPNVESTVDVGALVVKFMMQDNAQQTVQSFKLMSEPKFWISQGFFSAWHQTSSENGGCLDHCCARRRKGRRRRQRGRSATSIKTWRKNTIDTASRRKREGTTDTRKRKRQRISTC
jgi:hypothetical protein